MINLRAVVVAAVVVILDQLTKSWIVIAYPLGSEREVVPGLFRIVHTRNRGIAFGLLGSAGPLVQTALLLAVVVVIAVLVHQLRETGRDGIAGAGLALVLGGALGNLADRLLRGEVVDFLDFYARVGGRERHWPSFNVADSAITVGVACVLLGEIIAARRAKRVSRPA
jgi:signal peptidase II